MEILENITARKKNSAFDEFILFARLTYISIHDEKELKKR